MDQRIFDQLDQLERGARGHRHLHEFRADDNFGNPESYDYDRPALQLDSFDDRVLQQPDYPPQQWQAAPGHTRQYPPQDTWPHQYEDIPRSQEAFAAQVSRYAFDDSLPGPSSPSPRYQRQPSNPAYVGSRQRQPSFDEDPESVSTGFRRQHLIRQRPLYQPEHQEELDFEDSQPAESMIDIPEKSYASRQQDQPPPSNMGSRPVVVQGITLVSTRQLPDRVRAVFPFPLFNAVQSKSFDVVYRTNDNFVLSSPTGSGKTAVLELAICRLITSYTSGTFKIVYQAPTKSLCSERQRDWQAKFGPLDLQCAELTGDTENAQLRMVQNASIIITTPEKWDSMTRKWKDHQKLMQLVKLFLIDEVHILKEDRGATLEAVVSRMKGLGTDVRFVALSATVPNSQDIATWLGKNHNTPYVPAPVEKFGEEFRPVRLQKHVCGYQNGSNDFAFDSFLNGKLPDVISKYSQHKPLMVFCFTRKACVDTAKLLASWWSSSKPSGRYWEAPRQAVGVVESDLRETVPAGVAFHHAGLTIEDRLAVEKGYLRGDINVICCTSTLAVGVNLPCHMVIIKSTITYQNSSCKEYSDLEIMQMLGRAGRPQFDNSAVAVIMTRLSRMPFYEKMISGQEVLESCLHLNLIDHFNAEIGLGTINSASSAKKWLTGTFLYVRLRDNPEHYKLEGDAPGRNLDERLENICSRAIALLQESDLVRGSPKLQCTEFGDAMARYYLQFETMKIFLALPPNAKISEILSAIAQAAEYKDVRFRAGEKPAYKELNKNMSIKFPLPVNVDQPAHKVSLVIQSVLGAIDLPTEDYKVRTDYTTCKLTVFHAASRLIKCIVDCQLFLEDSVSARNALMLARSLGAQVWDDSPLTMKQLGSVGPVYVRKLVSAGIKSIQGILSTEPHRIEGALSRNPPFGRDLQEKAKAFPSLRISMKTMGEPALKKGEGVSVRIKAEIGFLNEKIPETFNRKSVYVCVLVDTSDGRKVHFARISGMKLNRGQDVLFSADLTSAGQVFRGFIMCDEIAGTQQVATLKPKIPAFMFPTPKKADELSKQREGSSRAPNTSKRRAIAAANTRLKEDDDDFGDAGLDDDDLVLAEADGFANIDDFNTSEDEEQSSNKPAKKKGNVAKRPPTEPKEAKEPKESHQLPNGKWACNHACKDKTKCKHMCCRDGLDTKPKPPKPKKQKEAKEAELSSDPKQTRLDMSKIKKPKSSTQNAPAVPRKVDTKEMRALNRVASNVTTSTANVPLLKKSVKLTQHVGEAPIEDFGFLPLNSDDPVPEHLPDDEDMLDTGDDLQQDENDQAEDRNEDPSPFPDDYNAHHDKDWSYFDDDTLDADALEVAASNAVAQSQTAFQEDDLLQPLAKEKGIIVAGDSSESLVANAMRNDAGFEDFGNDTGEFLPPAKRQKTDRQNVETELYEQVADDPPTTMMQGNEFLEEVLADDSAQINAATEETSTKEWFLREFGSDMFNFVD